MSFIPHRLLAVNQIRDTSKEGDDWKSFEEVGRSFFICNCGWTSGWRDKPSRYEYSVMNREHQ